MAEPLLQDSEQPKRPYSIDLSLELERQLDNESLPPTPAPTALTARPASLDQTVLASIIHQLQNSLTEVTKERDDLWEKLAKANGDKGGMEETLQQFSYKCEKMEEELEEAKAKMRDDEHAISMLRTKVEESRRGLMRLQTENRRMSQASMSIDTTRTSLTSFGTPSSSKRASFTPLTGSGTGRMNGHNRISSLSDSSFLLSTAGPSSDYPPTPSPNAQTVTIPDFSSSTNSSHPPVSSRRFSGIFGRGSPPQALDLTSQDPLIEELEALRREMKTIKADLEDTRHELSEANEAREASETCAKALREFIAEGKAPASETGPVKLPPMPSMTTGEEADTKKAPSGWGAFRMWKMEPATKTEDTISSAPVGTRRMWKVDTAVSSGSSETSPSSTRPTPMSAPIPFTSKVGGFFSSRASISSITSATLPLPQTLPREPSFNGSDTSSIEESIAGPISPTNEVPGEAVMVRGTSASSSTEFDSPEHVKALQDSTTDVKSIMPTPTS